MCKRKVVTNPFPTEGNIGVDEMSVTYVQDPDTNDDQTHYQLMKITTVSVPGCHDDELSYYFNIEIPPFDDGEPGHFSVDSKDELEAIFNDFLERLECTRKKVSKNKEDE